MDGWPLFLHSKPEGILMTRSALLIYLFLFAPLLQAQTVPPEICIANAFGAIADFERYVDPKNNPNAEWVETRCSRQGDDIYRMELIANCNDDDSATVNTITISAASNKPFERCATGPNKNAKCKELIPGGSEAISVTAEELAAWEVQLRSICELYVYTSPEDQ
jgi:hypothetical protein